MTDPATEALPADHQPENAPDDVQLSTPKPRRLPPRTIGLIATAGALVLALIVVGIVFAVNAPSAAPLMPSASPSSSAESASPSAAPVHVEAPQPTLALSCDALVPASDLAAVNPAASRAVVADDDFSVALAQAGGTECTWNPTGVSRSYDDRVMLSVLPDGESAYLGNYDWVPHDGYSIFDTAGDHSLITCNAWGGFGSCQAHVTVRGYWIAVTVNRSTGITEREQLEGPMMSLLDHLAAAVQSAPADRPTPTPMPGAFTGERLCADGVGITQSAFGWSGVERSYGEGDGGWITSFADERVGVNTCSFDTGSKYLWYSTLPSGAWYVDQMVARMPFDGSRGAYSQVDLAGADATLVACDSNGCEAVISYRFSRLQVSGGPIDRAMFVEGLQKLVAALG